MYICTLEADSSQPYTEDSPPADAGKGAAGTLAGTHSASGADSTGAGTLNIMETVNIWN